MRRVLAWGALLAAALGGAAAQGSAQQFTGTGPVATEFFRLDDGLAVFEMEHAGGGRFVVRLLDERGTPLQELARASGLFQGSKAVRVPREGRYLLDVEGSGAWSIRLREAGAADAASAGLAADTASPAYRAGAEAAGRVPTGGWLARGFLGGAVAGPIGAAVVVGMAGRSDTASPPAAENGTGDPGDRAVYEAGFSARLERERRKRAFVGGMMGTGVFLAGLIWALDIAGAGGGGTEGGDGGGTELILIPR